MTRALVDIQDLPDTPPEEDIGNIQALPDELARDIIDEQALPNELPRDIGDVQALPDEWLRSSD